MLCLQLGEPETPPAGGPKEKKRKKLDDIVLGLSAAKGQSVFSPPASVPSASPSERKTPNLHSPPMSAHPRGHSGSKEGKHQQQQQLPQNIFSNPLLTLSLFNSAAGKDLSRLAAAGGAQSSSSLAKNTNQSPKVSKESRTSSSTAAGGGHTSQSSSRNQQKARADANTNAQNLFLSGLAGLPSGSHLSEMPKCDLSRLAELAVPKFDLFSHDAKVNKWLAEHANLTPDRPVSPEFMDGRRRRRPRVDPMLLDWNKLSGEENVPVVNRLSGKKVRPSTCSGNNNEHFIVMCWLTGIFCLGDRTKSTAA